MFNSVNYEENYTEHYVKPAFIMMQDSSLVDFSSSIMENDIADSK